jgi:hypothetical protein
MIRSAVELQGNGYNKRAINSEVKDVLRSLEAKILRTSKDGGCSIESRVPKIYSSVGTDVDSVIIIVSSILRELVDAGYEVSISDLGSTYLFSISWNVRLSLGERTDITTFMAKHMTVKKNHLSD